MRADPPPATQTERHTMPQAGRPRRELWRARLAVSSVFFVVGFAFASWAARVPAIRDGLHLSDGQLALALLGLNGGAMLSLPIAGGLVARLGSRTQTVASLAVYLTALPLLALAPSLPLLAAALLLFAAGNSGVDVAMNAQGVLVERAYGRPVLGGFHAMFSLGGLAGAGASALLASAGIGVTAHFTAVAVVLVVLVAGAATALLPDGVRNGTAERPPVFALPTRAQWLPGVICFCAMFGEGIVNDWAAVYLHDITGATPGMAAAGFAVFSAFMVIGRLCADRARDRLGTVGLLLTCGTTAAAGAVLLVAVPVRASSLAGCALLGLGLAAIVPVVFAYAAPKDPGRSGPAIAAVSAVGYTGFLAGPPLIGGIAQGTGLRPAMLVLPLVMLTMTFLASRLPIHRSGVL